MVFGHDTEEAMVAAVALVNSADTADPQVELEQLTTLLYESGYTGVLARDEAEMAQVRALRPELRRLLTAERDQAVQIVNQILREARALPQLVRHDDTDWHLHAVEDNRPLAERIAVETAMAMVDVIRADEMSRLDVCADPDCEGIVLDLSRNRSRRFCSPACGNRAAVAAYRARRSG